MSFFVFLNRIYGGCKNCRKYSCLSKNFYNVYDLHIQKKGTFYYRSNNQQSRCEILFQVKNPCQFGTSDINNHLHLGWGFCLNCKHSPIQLIWVINQTLNSGDLLLIHTVCVIIDTKEDYDFSCRKHPPNG